MNTGKDFDAVSASRSEGARDGRAALLRDVEAFRDEWLAAASASDGDPPLVSLCRDIAFRLTAIIDRHAKDAPAGPDLREAAQELWNAVAHDVTDESTWVGTAMARLQAALAAHTSPATPDLRAMVAELEAGKKWQNKLLDDIRALEADRDSWKKANERASLSSAESAAEVERIRDKMDDAFESGYIQGHNDTVESQYREPADAAEDYRLSLAAAAAPAAPKAEDWRGPWKCDRCSREFHKPLALHYPWNITTFGVSTAEFCSGTLVPYERRKGR